MTAPKSCAPAQGHVLARGAVIATVMVFGLTYSLSAPLIALDLAGRGFGETVIGANAAMYAFGVLATALVLPRLVARFGPRRVVLVSIGISAAALGAFPLLPSLAAWFALRTVLGMASEALFVTSETWVNALSSEQSRARSMGAYTSALAVGLALGPLILSFVGTAGALAYIIGAGIALAAGAFVASPRIAAPHFDEPTITNPLRYLRLAPLALSAVALTAALETAGLSFLPLYAAEFGWSTASATRLATVMMAGAILLQIPIGWLGDTIDRRRLVIGLSLAAMLGAALLPLALLGPPPALYALLFAWGGACVGIYTIMVTLVGSRFKGGDLIGIYAVTGFFWGVGSLVGPLGAGLFMQLHGHGFALFAAMACGAFALAAWRLKGIA